jgi:hypothetical protein
MGASSGIGGARRFGDDARGVRDAADAPFELRVEARTRWDALELLRRLHALRTARTYMIQSGPERWLVYARPHAHGTLLEAELEAAVASWRIDRGLADA